MSLFDNCSRGRFRARLGTAAVFLGSSLAACGDEATAPLPSHQLLVSTTNIHTIKSIDGRRLPVTICAGNVKVIAGTLRLRSSNTFLASVRISSPPGAPRETYQETGTYSRQAGTTRIVFRSTTRPGTRWNGTALADGSIRVRYPVCGEIHSVRVSPDS